MRFMFEFGVVSLGEPLFDRLTPLVANLYCSIWKEYPWCEDFWKADEVQVMMQDEYARRNVRAFYAYQKFDKSIYPQLKDHLDPVRFTWAYEVSIEELEEISFNPHIRHHFEDHLPVFYVDELGVASGFRQFGVGKCLTRHIINSYQNFCKNGHIVLRTDVKAEAAKRLYQKMGFKEIPIIDGKYPTRTYWVLTY